MIARIWHGWTTGDNAEAYESLLRSEVIPGITAKGVRGYRRFKLLRRRLDSGEVEFTTIMWFDSLEAVKEFAGEDYERAYVPEKARRVLARSDDVSQHFELRDQWEYSDRG